MDPWADPFDSGFQLTQSLIAIGRGEWFGVGLGESVQKLFYLPEAHTDFLFAVLAEELGLMGVLLTLALFLALVWRGFHVARLASEAGLKFPAYLAAGFGMWVGIQAFINIGVNMGVLPTKGLTLPLMSYGRSSLLVTLAWVGLLLRVYHEADARAARLGARVAGRRDERGRYSSWPAAPADTCSRRWRWRDCCASSRAKSCGWAPSAGSRRGSCRQRAFPIEWLSVGGLRGKGALTLLAAPFRLVRALLQALAVMRRHRPAWWWGWADS